MEIDTEALELLERRLAEKIETRVRARLFKFYGAVGVVALSILSFFGYNIISGLEDQAKNYAQSAVAPSVDTANAAADKARAQTNAISARLEALDEFQARRERQLLESEGRVLSARAKVDQLAADIETRLGAILDKLTETEAQLEAQSERTKDAAGIANVAEVAQSLADLTRQVQALDDQLREIREKAPVGLSYVAPLADRGQIDAVLRQSTAQTVLPVARGSGDVVVYFQFAGVRREDAQAISARLAARGYEMPGEERTKSASGRREVRFFFEDDGDRARTLVDDVNRILAASSYQADVEIRDFTDFKGRKPQPGTVELWLEPVRIK